jgi:hypothetical protein
MAGHILNAKHISDGVIFCSNMLGSGMVVPCNLLQTCTSRRESFYKMKKTTMEKIVKKIFKEKVFFILF